MAAVGGGGRGVGGGGEEAKKTSVGRSMIIDSR